MTLKHLSRLLRRTARQVTGTAPRIAVDHRCERQLLGSDYGRWCVCPSRVAPGAIVYSFGIGDDISFERQLIEHHGVQVHAFDPSCADWIVGQSLPDGFHFHPFGLADFDGEARFRPLHPGWISYAVEGTGVATTGPDGDAQTIGAPVRRLATIMRDLGHESVAVLKMDIEGAEYGALHDMLASAIRPDQVLVEFHYQFVGRPGVERTRAAVRALRDGGYRAFYRSPLGHECAFARIERIERIEQIE